MFVKQPSSHIVVKVRCLKEDLMNTASYNENMSLKKERVN